MGTLDQMYQQRNDLTNQLDELDENIKRIRLELAKGLEVVQRTGSVVIFSKTTGHGIVADRKNRHGEYIISHWHQKRGEEITRGFRGGPWVLRNWYINNYC